MLPVKQYKCLQTQTMVNRLQVKRLVPRQEVDAIAADIGAEIPMSASMLS